jgi:nitrite reductase (NADH) large subunit
MTGALHLFGEGLGCETCKPAIASIFASITMEAQSSSRIQDTNDDRFFMNIQRNGTSVVPTFRWRDYTE